ncbi:unnamed protein product [Brachionus calyciflorus]|uniref:Uncharacterized protein n=1 Tax=Brachionus calyciflorus TaxID=104777 RepID=A0A814M6B5_9BILA|nr:unnamed protein product [Brachionus calyciflorus]
MSLRKTLIRAKVQPLKKDNLSEKENRPKSSQISISKIKTVLPLGHKKIVSTLVNNFSQKKIVFSQQKLPDQDKIGITDKNVKNSIKKTNLDQAKSSQILSRSSNLNKKAPIAKQSSRQLARVSSFSNKNTTGQINQKKDNNEVKIIHHEKQKSTSQQSLSPNKTSNSFIFGNSNKTNSNNQYIDSKQTPIINDTSNIKARSSVIYKPYFLVQWLSDNKFSVVDGGCVMEENEMELDAVYQFKFSKNDLPAVLKMTGSKSDCEKQLEVLTNYETIRNKRKIHKEFDLESITKKNCIEDEVNDDLEYFKNKVSEIENIVSEKNKEISILKSRLEKSEKKTKRF